MKILLVGASSYVGARLYNDLDPHHRILGTYFTNKFSDKLVSLDITDKQAVEKLVKDFAPDWIIHVANNASASWCEVHPDEARKLNLDATQHIVDAANSAGTRLIFISSYAVFDTSTLYARLKKESEDIVSKTNAGFLILRPSVIMGVSPNTENDRPFNRILKAINEKAPALFDTSWKFQPTYIGHISEVILKSVDENSGKNPHNEIIHVIVEGVKSQYDIAKDIMSHFNLKPEPIDKQFKIPLVEKDLAPLKKIGLSFYDYESLIDTVIKEIRQYNE